MEGTIAGSINYKINIYSTLAGSMNGKINMNSTIAESIKDKIQNKQYNSRVND
jgi:hypothetical protein